MRAEIVCNFQSLRILAQRTLLLDVNIGENCICWTVNHSHEDYFVNFFITEMFLLSAAPQSRCQELFCPAGRGLPSAKMMKIIWSLFVICEILTLSRFNL